MCCTVAHKLNEMCCHGVKRNTFTLLGTHLLGVNLVLLSHKEVLISGLSVCLFKRTGG